MCLDDQAKECSPTDQPVRNFKNGLGTNIMTMKTFFSKTFFSIEKRNDEIFSALVLS